MNNGSYNREVFHGGDLDHAMSVYGSGGPTWIDLSTGINPHPYPIPELSTEAWVRLPSASLEKRLHDAARLYYGISSETPLVAASGTQAIIQLLPLLIDCAEVAIICPTYAEHAKCWSDHGHKIIEVSDLDKIPSTTDIAVVVSPNNPTGKEYDKTDLLRLAKNLKARNGFLVLDEAFGDVSDQTTPTTGLRLEGIVALKSFGKFFGLAGLRLGFAIGDTEIITKLHAALGPWAVSGIPMEVAIKAFCDTQWISSTRKTLANNRARLEQLLIQSGFNIAGGTSLFTYAQHPQAEQIFNLLCRAHILTRPFEHSPEKLRFGHPATEAEWDRLQNALKDA